MTLLLFKNFFRVKATYFGIIFLFFMLILSIQMGKDFLDKNKINIQKTEHFQKESINRNVKFHSNDLGLLMYYVKFGIVNEISNLAALSMGQHNINPNTQSVTIRNLEEQKYNSDLQNPWFQHLGNFDFTFVIIYLFPLLIIAFCYNIIAEEKEDGTWKLLLIQSKNFRNILITKFLIRFFSLYSVFVISVLIAVFYLKIPINKDFIVFFLLLSAYLIFWFSVCWLIISFNKSSSNNSLALLSIWVLLTLIIPSILNSISFILYPIPEGVATMIESREGYHDKWDEEKEPTIQKFKEIYPQYKNFKHPENEDFSWFWYFAMQQMGDYEAATISKKFKDKLQLRNNFTKNVGVLFPTTHTLFEANNLAKSDFENFKMFTSALENFHEQKKKFYLFKIFNNEKISPLEWSKVKLEYFSSPPKVNLLRQIMPLVIIIFICIFFANKQITNIKFN